MQIAAANPEFVNEADVPADRLNKEKRDFESSSNE